MRSRSRGPRAKLHAEDWTIELMCVYFAKVFSFLLFFFFFASSRRRFSLFVFPLVYTVDGNLFTRGIFFFVCARFLFALWRFPSIYIRNPRESKCVYIMRVRLANVFRDRPSHYTALRLLRTHSLPHCGYALSEYRRNIYVTVSTRNHHRATIALTRRFALYSDTCRFW